MQYPNELILYLAILILPILASLGVKITFARYKNTPSARNIRAEQVARYILDQNGLQHIRIEHTRGYLTDHFSPLDKVVRLSDATYGKTSIAAIGVAAHECGHAIQHAHHYVPIMLRTAFVPITNLCSKLWYLAFILGIAFFDTFPQFLYAGIAMFGAVVIFQLVTLPVELNASHRALVILKNGNILQGKEISKTRKVLTAAAMTYVTALVTSILQLLRLIMRAQSRSRR